MPRYLVTFKPEKYHTPSHSYAILAEIDWETKQVIREIRFPTAVYTHPQAFMAPATGGICETNGRIFVALWNYIVEVDYETFAIVNSFSHPYTVDLHGMDIDGKYLYVTATAIDAVLCFDIETSELVWRWGPDETILYEDRIASQLQSDVLMSIPIVRSYRQQRVYRQERFVDGEYRFRHKKNTGYHHHHLNDVILHENSLYVTTKQWNKKQKGAIIKLDLETHEAEFFVQPDSLDGLHDGIWVNDNFYVTESGANQVAWCDAQGQVTHHKIEPSPYFVRGLCDTGTSWLVGFTTLRDTGLPAKIVEFNRDFTETISTMDVSGFYPSEKSTAIHSILRSPIHT